MEVAIHHAGHIGGVRNDRQNLLQVKLVERYRQVLQHFRIVVIGVNLHTHAVGGTEFEIG